MTERIPFNHYHNLSNVLLIFWTYVNINVSNMILLCLHVIMISCTYLSLLITDKIFWDAGIFGLQLELCTMQGTDQCQHSYQVTTVSIWVVYWVIWLCFDCMKVCCFNSYLWEWFLRRILGSYLLWLIQHNVIFCLLLVPSVFSGVKLLKA